MVQGLLIRCGGHITVESQPGRGSKFQLLFSLTSPQEPLLKGRAEPQELRRGTGQHVAVVDDEPAVTRYLSELLQGQGYRVTQFNKAVEALAAIEDKGQAFDLVITDQTMPAINGTELAMRLHRTLPDLPVILCTGYGSAMDEEDVHQARIRYQFTKPVSANALFQAMADSLDSSDRSAIRSGAYVCGRTDQTCGPV
jgi:CheY-like chemotaxis protein